MRYCQMRVLPGRRVRECVLLSMQRNYDSRPSSECVIVECFIEICERHGMCSWGRWCRSGPTVGAAVGNRLCRGLVNYCRYLFE